ncbi:MAG: DegT/DnrJ/EryC1/StrS family aminotransferase [Nitrosarchaeum sp.]
MKYKIQHNKPTLGREEEEAALRVLRSDWLSQGPEVEAFENDFCRFMGLPKGHSIAVSNGTSALFLSLWALKTTGKRVSFPAYACSAIRHSIAMIKGYENPTDITKNSPNIDLTRMDQNTDISIIPHMYGIPVDLTDYDTTNVIEDCAQALGAKINGKLVGLQGVFGVFSFYASKLMTSGGQGGMVISENYDLINSIRDYREFDYRRDDKKRFNFQMTDLQAAIGREQLKKIPRFLNDRERIFNLYKEAGFELLDIDKNDKRKISPVRYRAIVKTENSMKMISSLASSGIEAKIPTEDWELLGDPQLLPNALELTKNTVSLPIYPSLSNDEVSKIIQSTKSFFENE